MCLDHTSESGCKYGDNKCFFLHTDAVGQPSKESKVAQKDRWLLLKETVQLRRASHDCHQRKSFQGKMEILDRITQSSSQRPRCVPYKLVERRVHRRESFKKCEPQGAKTMGFKIRGTNARRNPETGAVRLQKRLWELAKDVYSLQKESTDTLPELG